MQLEPDWRMACQTRIRHADGRIELWTPHWGEFEDNQ
jgi:hypothetical protein